MNIKRNNTSSRKLITLMITGVFLLALGAYTAYAYKVGPFAYLQEKEKEDAASRSDATNPQQKANLPSVEEEAKTGANKTTDEIPVADSGTLQITALEQRDTNIIYAASLQNATTQGTCSALFEHTAGAARPVTRVTTPTADGCPETTISQVEFVARGTWKLTLRYFVNDTQLVATKTFEVN